MTQYYKAEILIEVEDHWVDWTEEEEQVEWLESRLKQEKHFKEDTCEIKFFPLDLEDDFPCHVLKLEKIEEIE